MVNAGGVGHSAGETSLAAATAAIITARWTAPAKATSSAAGNGANGHSGNGHAAANGHAANGHGSGDGLANGHGPNGHHIGDPSGEPSGFAAFRAFGSSAVAESFGASGVVDSFGAGGVADALGAGLTDAVGAGGAAEVAGGAADAFGAATSGAFGAAASGAFGAAASGAFGAAAEAAAGFGEQQFSAWAPPARPDLEPPTGLPSRTAHAASPGLPGAEPPADAQAPFLHEPGSTIGGAAATFFAPAQPDPVPEVFDPFIPAQRGVEPDSGLPGRAPGWDSALPGRDVAAPGWETSAPSRDAAAAGWETLAPGRDVAAGPDQARTQVPPGFERRDFGPFPDEPAPAPATSVEPPRGFETVAPTALLGSLPSAPPEASAMPTSFAPPEPPAWTDPGWVGFGDLLSSPGEQDGPTEGPGGAGAHAGGTALGSLPRRVPGNSEIPDLPIFDSEAEADPVEEDRNLNRVATFLRDDEEGSTEQPRPDGIDLAAVLEAVRGVPHVRDAQVRWNGQAGHTLRIEFADGVDQSEVTRSVVKLLRQRLGLAALPSTDEPTADSPFRGRASAGGTGRQPARPPGVAAARPLPRPSTVEAPRLVVENVTVTRLGAEAVVEVRLRLPGGAVAVGEGRGPGVDAYLSRVAATAAAHAVDQALRADGRERGRAFIEHVSVVPFGVVEVALVVLLLSYDGVTEQLSGSAIVGDDPHLAVVRATLAALNRRLESLLG